MIPNVIETYFIINKEKKILVFCETQNPHYHVQVNIPKFSINDTLGINALYNFFATNALLINEKEIKKAKLKTINNHLQSIEQVITYKYYMNYLNLTSSQITQILDVCEKNGLEPDFVSLDEFRFYLEHNEVCEQEVIQYSSLNILERELKFIHFQ